jgi:hypothetical protein
MVSGLGNIGVGSDPRRNLHEILNSKKSYLDIPDLNARVKLVKSNNQFAVKTESGIYPIPKELKKITQVLDWLRRQIIAKNISGTYKINDVLLPGESSSRKRAIETKLMNNKIDEKIKETLDGNVRRYRQAVSMFPALGQYKVTPVLVMAVIRNEISNYDPGDERQDLSAKKGQAGDDTTLGYGQISSKGAHGLRNDFPQLDKLLSEQGFPNNQLGNQRALVNPLMVPYFVAAKLASIASIYEKSPQGNIKITPESIIYGYNADVFANQPKTSEDLKVGLQWKLFPGMKKVFPGSGLNEWIEQAAKNSTYVQGVQKNTMELLNGWLFNSSF